MVSTEQIRAALRDVVDPELGYNIVELGLLRDVQIDEVDANTRVRIDLTLTSPACPLGPEILQAMSSCLN